MTNISTINQVERVCADLRHNGQSVTFTAVAARAGLGRSTLYRNPAIRAVIDEHRHRAAAGGTLAGLTNEINTLTAALEALADRVKHHDEQLRRLKSRNE